MPRPPTKPRSSLGGRAGLSTGWYPDRARVRDVGAGRGRQMGRHSLTQFLSHSAWSRSLTSRRSSAARHREGFISSSAGSLARHPATALATSALASTPAALRRRPSRRDISSRRAACCPMGGDTSSLIRRRLPRWEIAHDPALRRSPGSARPALLATFTKHERAEIAASPDLGRAIHEAEPADWPGIMRRHRKAQRVALEPYRSPPPDDDGMRRQALHDLKRPPMRSQHWLTIAEDSCLVLPAASPSMWRTISCPMTRHCAALREAAAANGSLTRYGQRWADDTIRRALIAGRNDTLPPLARRFRTKGAGHEQPGKSAIRIVESGNSESR